MIWEIFLVIITATESKNRKESEVKKQPLMKIVEWLDDYLKIESYKQADNALNGLQVASVNQSVKKVALAVDACLSTFEKSHKIGVDLICVHHGLFWGKQASIIGNLYERVKYLQENQLALYAVHLPLDAHQESGNNRVISEQLGLKKIKGFGDYRGVIIGIEGEWETPISMEKICHLMKVESEGKEFLNFGKSEIKKVGIVSGAAASMVIQAIKKGFDLFITGESSHEVYHLCKEQKMNIIFAGHYQTETGGVRAVGKLLEKKFGIESEFIEDPTGL